MKKLFLFLLFTIVILSSELNAQIDDYSLVMEEVNIESLPGVQSFAVGQVEGKWLIAGGRIEGLHLIQPFTSFADNLSNKNLIVVDPVSKETWTAPLTSLSVSLQEQLSSTNCNFFQEGNTLYFLGGYGYSSTAADHVTYDKLTAIKLEEVINAIINNEPFAAYFRQISDPQFAVTGCHLEKIYDTYYLTGGNRFDGRYNPNNNSSFTQAYTDQVRKFHIEDDGTNLSVTHLTPYTDSENLHRRDYNVTAQIMPDGKQGLTAFSGVFQIGVNLPFLNCVNIDSAGYTVNNDFSQYYNHYHCANIPIYDALKNEMHTIFFGGIAQYFDLNGVLTQDDNVPFVKTIARVSRNSQGVMTEHKLSIEMPGLLGASSEFIPNTQLEHYENEVIKLNSFNEDSNFLGYIFGGISSTAENIFFINDGTQSSATNKIFKVYLVKNEAVSVSRLNPQSIGTLKMQIYPNPVEDELKIKYNLDQKLDVDIIIRDLSGKKLYEENYIDKEAGEHLFIKSVNDIGESGIYIIKIQTAFESATQKLILTK